MHLKLLSTISTISGLRIGFDDANFRAELAEISENVAPPNSTTDEADFLLALHACQGVGNAVVDFGEMDIPLSTWR